MTCSNHLSDLGLQKGNIDHNVIYYVCNAQNHIKKGLKTALSESMLWAHQ